MEQTKKALSEALTRSERMRHVEIGRSESLRDTAIRMHDRAVKGAEALQKRLVGADEEEREELERAYLGSRETVLRAQQVYQAAKLTAGRLASM